MTSPPRTTAPRDPAGSRLDVHQLRWSKVFPEEVEQALKTHPDVFDALVVGVPDPRFGEDRVAAVVQLREGLDAGARRGTCRALPRTCSGIQDSAHPWCWFPRYGVPRRARPTTAGRRRRPRPADVAFAVRCDADRRGVVGDNEGVAPGRCPAPGTTRTGDRPMTVDLRAHVGPTGRQGAVRCVLLERGAALRCPYAEPLGFDRDLWVNAAETRCARHGFPEAPGGGGASLGDLVVVAEKFGRRRGDAAGRPPRRRRLAHPTPTSSAVSPSPPSLHLADATAPGASCPRGPSPTSSWASMATRSSPSGPSRRARAPQPRGGAPRRPRRRTGERTCLGPAAEFPGASPNEDLTAGVLVGIGHRRCAIGARLRDGSGTSSACRSARSRPSSRPGRPTRSSSTAAASSPTRPRGRRARSPARRHRPRRQRHHRLRDARSMAFVFASDGAAACHRPQPPLPRRLRLRRGVRHPAVLPTGPRLGAGGRRPPRACSTLRRSPLRPDRRAASPWTSR